jgi:hypothetical protein
VEELGGVVEILPLVEDRSTTGLIERIRAAYAREEVAAATVGPTGGRPKGRRGKSA